MWGWGGSSLNSHSSFFGQKNDNPRAQCWGGGGPKKLIKKGGNERCDLYDFDGGIFFCPPLPKIILRYGNECFGKLLEFDPNAPEDIDIDIDPSICISR